MLERMPDVIHERHYLSDGRSPARALGSLPVYWPRLARRIRNFDLIHVHGDAAAIIVLPLVGRRPTLITTHGLHLWRRLSGPRRALVGNLLRFALSRGRVIVCTSGAEEQELNELLPSTVAKNLRVVYNGIDVPAPTRVEERLAARARFGIDAGAILGVFVGRLEPRKAPLLAVAAGLRVRSHGLPFVIAVAGSGPEASELQKLAGPGLRSLGHLDDVGDLMRAADIFLQPSEREGLSFAVLDAMGFGLPVIAADGPGNPEAVGGAGVIFPAGDELALAEALRTMCEDEQRRSALGAAARLRVEERFSAESFVAETRTAYLDTVFSTISEKAAAGAG